MLSDSSPRNNVTNIAVGDRRASEGKREVQLGGEFAPILKEETLDSDLL